MQTLFGGGEPMDVTTSIGFLYALPSRSRRPEPGGVTWFEGLRWLVSLQDDAIECLASVGSWRQPATLGKKFGKIGRVFADLAIFFFVRGRTTRPRPIPRIAVNDSRSLAMSRVNRIGSAKTAVLALAAVVCVVVPTRLHAAQFANVVVNNTTNDEVLIEWVAPGSDDDWRELPAVEARSADGFSIQVPDGIRFIYFRVVDENDTVQMVEELNGAYTYVIQ